MIYLPFIVIIVGAFIYYFYEKSQVDALKEDGVKVVGTIIYNNDGPQYTRFRLGGNFNRPVITFFTKDGEAITGKPINEFTSQFEIIVPSEINIIYDPGKPQKFCVDL